MVKKAKRLQFVEHTEAPRLQLDLGTGRGRNKPAGYLGVDCCPTDGVDLVCDLAYRNGAGWEPWPWQDGSVDDVNCHYLLQCLSAEARVHFANELWRVLKVGAQARIVTPYWCANRAFMTLEVQWPPVAEGWYQSLNRDWREAQNYVDRSGLTCHFEFTLSHGMHPAILARNIDYQTDALTWWKEAAQDLHATVTKLAAP